jgi:SAM-dependent methyltransferase
VSSHGIGSPSPWIERFGRLVRAGGTVLDVASGAGRHSRWFAARGHRVTAIDRDDAALGALAGMCGTAETIVFDLEAGARWPLAGRTFDAVVVTNYLHRPLFGDLLAALAPGGVLLYETFAAGNARFGRPSNPAFLLAPGELLARCAELDVVAFEDGLDGDPPQASLQRICAVRRAPDGGTLRHAL